MERTPTQPTDVIQLRDACRTFKLPDYQDVAAVQDLILGLHLLHQHLSPQTWEAKTAKPPLLFADNPTLTEKLLRTAPPEIILTNPSQDTCYSFNQRGYYQNQEDSLLIKEAHTTLLYAVADGLGGRYDGDKASQHVIKTLKNAACDLASLQTAIEYALTTMPTDRSMGTTLSVALRHQNHWYCISIGDSPIVIYTPQSAPYTVTNDTTPSGAMAWCLGSDNQLETLEIIRKKCAATISHPLSLPENATLIVATDGINPFLNNLPETEVSRIMCTCTPEAIGLMIKAYTLLLGSWDVDNHTAIIHHT